MNTDTEKIFKVLQEIQSRIPPAWTKAAVIEVPYTPHLRDVVDKALAEKDFPVEKKEELQKLKESGDLDKTFPMENKKVTKLIDQFVNREINKAIKEKRLPPRGKIKDINGLKEIYAKVHNQENQRKDRA